MRGKKKISLIYLLAIVLFAIFVTLSYLETFWDNTTGKYFQFGAGVSSGALAVFEFLTKHISLFRKIKRKILKWLKIDSEENEETVYTNINKEQLEKVKTNLLFQVDKYCTQLLANFEKSTPMIKDGRPVKTKYVVFDNFKDYLTTEKGSYRHTEGVHTHVRLAIVGQAGSGKTFSLVREIEKRINQITEQRQQNNYDNQVPVYLSLNSWKNHISFSEWLQERIPREYRGCSPQNIKTLLGQCEILVFVDGLDELDEEERSKCFRALLNFSKGQSIIFSCRNEKLLELLREINTDEEDNIAVWELQPLDKPKIESAINSARQDASDIFNFLNSKEELYHFLVTPLTLNLFLGVFDSLNENSKEQLKAMDEETFKLFLLEKYDELKLAEKPRPWPVAKIRTYMVWLAKRTKGNSFFIEDLQPDWLEKRSRIFLYYLTSRIISCIILAIGVGLFIAGPLNFIGSATLAAIFIASLTLRVNRRQKNKTYPYWWTILLFTLVLLIITTLYHGFSVPRQETDMPRYLFNSNFSITESFAGILLGLFLGIIFGSRKFKQNSWIDIRPVEKNKSQFKFNWKNAIHAGIVGGTCIGLFLAMCGIVIHSSLRGNTFDRWLTDNAGRFMSFAPLHIFMQIAIFGFLAGLFIGFLIFTLMGGRDEAIVKDITSSENKAKNRLNRGMIVSFKCAWKYGSLTLIFVALTYGAFVYWLTKEPGSLIRGASMAAGTGIISFLWFGGFEVIQHWTLRFYLYLFGIAPLRYAKWVKMTEDSALLRRVGPSLQLYHPDLRLYYTTIPADDSMKRVINLERKGWLNLVSLIGIPIIILLLAYPFFLKLNGSYWQKPASHSIFINSAAGVMRINDSTFVVNKAGNLNLAIAGKVQVGTFLGFHNATGTETGLLAFPITDVYDLEANCRHGSLIYKVNRKNKSTGWSHVVKDQIYFNNRLYSCIALQAGDSIIFKFNDNEWQNNRGNFTIRLSFADTCIKR